MKKTLTILGATALLFSAACTSCKKDNNSSTDGNNGSQAGSWKLGNKTYTTDTSYNDLILGKYLIQAIDNLDNGDQGNLQVFFFTANPPAGTYRVVRNYTLPHAADEIAIRMGKLESGSYSGYEATGTDNATATVSVSNNVVSVSVSSAASVLFTGGGDSLATFSCNAIRSQK